MGKHRVTVTYFTVEVRGYEGCTADEALERCREDLPPGAQVEAITVMTFGPDDD